MRRHKETGSPLLTIATASFLFAGVLASAGLAAEPLAPLLHIRLEAADATPVAELLIALRLADGDDEPLATVALLETDKGYRARLIAFTDPAAGVSVERFEDLSSGWWAEWNLDSGMRNLGDAADYPTPWQWLAEVEERRRSQRPIATYSILTSDGDRAEWEEPAFADPAEVAAAAADALAPLAVALRESAVPTSVREEIGRLVQLLQRSSDAVHFEDLVYALADALLISGTDSAPVESTGVTELRFDSRTPGVDTQPLADLLREIEESSCEGRKPAPETPAVSDDPSAPGV